MLNQTSLTLQYKAQFTNWTYLPTLNYMTYQKKKKHDTLVTFFQQYKVDLETLLTTSEKPRPNAKVERGSTSTSTRGPPHTAPIHTRKASQSPRPHARKKPRDSGNPPF